MNEDDDSGWDVENALRALRARIDPYIWEQGQELYRRGAVEDFALRPDGTIQLKVLDPRDARRFFVEIRRTPGDRVVAKCVCPYRLQGLCRHQVVALEYLRAIASGDSPAGEVAGGEEREATAEAVPPAEGSVLYRFSGEGSPVSTRADGSLLRLVVQSVGSTRTPHRVVLQLYTGTGWTELRSGEARRFIERGALGPHPRDAFLLRCLLDDHEIRREIDSDTFAMILGGLREAGVLVDGSGRELGVSSSSWQLAARIVSGSETEAGSTRGVAVVLECRSAFGERIAFEDVVLVPASAPWIQLATGTFHPLAAGAPGVYLEELQLEDLSSLRDAELDRLLSEGIERLERLCLSEVESAPDLIREVEGVAGARLRLSGTPERLGGRLELSYGDEWVEAPSTPEPWTRERDGTIQRFPPAGQSLARARHELEAVGFHLEDGEWVIDGEGVLARLLRPREGAFVALELPTEVVVFDAVSQAPRLEIEVRGGGERVESGGVGVGWLDATCRLQLGERALRLSVGSLLEALRQEKDVLELTDGTVLGLGHQVVRGLAELASEAQRVADADLEGEGGACPEDASARLRLPLRSIGILLEEVDDRSVSFEASAARFVEGLRGGGREPPAALAAPVRKILRPYQRAAVVWMDVLAASGLGGVLADEMGLGKTVMTLAHLFGHEGTRTDGLPTLVVCPTTLSFNWLAEARRFFPEVSVANLSGQAPGERERIVGEGNADLLVTSYALLRRDRELLEGREFNAVILDEAQHIKNPASQTAKAACALSARSRWALTGTPIENHLGELWSIFRFALPGLLGSIERFQETYAEPAARGEREALDRLRARVGPFLLRRTKDQVLADLPPRIEQVERVPMSAAQGELYASVLERARRDVKAGGAKEARFRILAALTRLRQICCHPSLVLEAVANDSTTGASAHEQLTGGKFELLEELVRECIDEEHRVLLFSQFTGMLDLIEARLDELRIRHCRLDGSTRDREGVVRGFQEDSSIAIFLISLKAGGFGLNLTQADTVIIYDPWWNPAVEEQAFARAHRIGQTVPVHLHRLITAGTVEEKILELQASKRDLAGRVVQATEEALETLSTDELASLLD